MSFLSVSKERGFFYQCTDEENFAKEGQIVGYCGFDPTGTSLHVGHLIQIMRLRWLQKTGNTPIILLGGGTALVGDPTGKDAQRPMLDKDAINFNIAQMQKVFAKYIDLNNAHVLNNADWLSKLNYIDFLRDIGSFFSVNRLLSLEIFKSRLEKELSVSFLEFNYPLIQGYDFLYLYQNYNCKLQMGGSDQWGNIISGVELVRKMTGNTVYGLTAPLIVTASGKKMGKTESGAVFLDAELTKPFDFWQYFRNTDDRDVGLYLRLLTELPISEIEAIEKGDINEAKKILADQTTALCHGSDVLADIHKSVASMFYADGENTDALPIITIPKGEYRLDDLLFTAQLFESKGEAKKTIVGGGVRINKEKQDDPLQIITLDIEMIVSIGKKKWFRIQGTD